MIILLKITLLGGGPRPGRPGPTILVGGRVIRSGPWIGFRGSVIVGTVPAKFYNQFLFRLNQ